MSIVSVEGKKLQNQHISHTKKFIWQRVAKCASSSILAHLDQHTSDLRTIRVGNKFFYASEDLKAFNDPSYYKFMFIRNPYARLVSCYRNKLKSKKALRAGPLMNSWRLEKISFTTFIRRVCSPEFILLNNHWKPFSKTLEDFSGTLDFIGKVENFNEDFTTVCNIIGLPTHKFPLKNYTLNKSRETQSYRKYINSGNQNQFKPDYHYSEYYTSETRELVANAYMSDFKTYNYSYDSPIIKSPNSI